MSVPTEECPCFMFTPIPTNTARCAVCGDPGKDHTPDGNCTVMHAIDEPYDPELTRLALESAQAWLNSPAKKPKT